MDSVYRVRDLMTPEVATLRENDSLSIADDVMRLGRVRHLPVLDEDSRLVGIVSQRDLLRGGLARVLGYGEFAQQKLMGTVRVKEVMQTKLCTITPDSPVSEAAQQMAEQKIGCLPVVEAGVLKGILTEGDFVSLFAREAART